MLNGLEKISRRNLDGHEFSKRKPALFGHDKRLLPALGINRPGPRRFVLDVHVYLPLPASRDGLGLWLCPFEFCVAQGKRPGFKSPSSGMVATALQKDIWALDNSSRRSAAGLFIVRSLPPRFGGSFGGETSRATIKLIVTDFPWSGVKILRESRVIEEQ